MTNTISSPPTQIIMRWNSPIPYLFGGLALILGLISLALMVLACSYLYKKKHDQLPSSSLDTGKPVTVNDTVARDDGPRVVVIMAGDEKPTYLAMPKNIEPPSDDSVNPPPPSHALPTEVGDDGQV